MSSNGCIQTVKTGEWYAGAQRALQLRVSTSKNRLRIIKPGETPEVVEFLVKTASEAVPKDYFVATAEDTARNSFCATVPWLFLRMLMRSTVGGVTWLISKRNPLNNLPMAMIGGLLYKMTKVQAQEDGKPLIVIEDRSLLQERINALSR